jgi:hypothetical protein
MFYGIFEDVLCPAVAWDEGTFMRHVHQGEDDLPRTLRSQLSLGTAIRRNAVVDHVVTAINYHKNAAVRFINRWRPCILGTITRSYYVNMFYHQSMRVWCASARSCVADSMP